MISGAALLAMFVGGCGATEDSGCRERTFWPDADGDGFGFFGEPLSACELPEHASENADDCDDTDAQIHPGGTEVCDDEDDDCDGHGDTGGTAWYVDADGDGFGSSGNVKTACLQPQGTVVDGTDCNDADASVFPGAVEVCDGDDDDCDGRPDLGGDMTLYADDDGDGYGDPDSSAVTCNPDPTWVYDDSDCDPTNGNVHPGATEVCNAFDDNCDGLELFCGYTGEYELGDDAGSKLEGEGSDDVGRLVDAGDLDGDGRDEIVIATLYASGYNGGGYIVKGTPPAGESSLTDSAYQISGSPETSGAGRSIGVGDANGDGFGDVVFGAPYSPGGDEAFVVFGPVDDDMDLVDADAELQGQSGTYCGHGSDLGDVTGDGIADATIGAYNTDGGRGTIYVVNGPLHAGTFDLADADATLTGDRAGQYTGRVVRSGADMDGDGIGDLITPAPYDGEGAPGAGKAFVVVGPSEGDSDLADAYMILIGAGANDGAGTDVAQADVDGDGRADAIVGAPFGVGTAGSVAWVSGDRTGTIGLADADATIFGDPGDQLGMNVDARDVDGDGLAELLVGATGNGGTGTVFLFYSPIVDGLLTSDAGAAFHGERNGDYLGQGVAFADIDGDTSADILLGAPSERTGGSGAGAVYVMSPDPP